MLGTLMITLTFIFWLVDLLLTLAAATFATIPDVYLMAVGVGTVLVSIGCLIPGSATSIDRF